MQEGNGFEIKCKDCGSTNCMIREIGTENYDGEWEPWGISEIICNDCGQCE